MIYKISPFLLVLFAHFHIKVPGKKKLLPEIKRKLGVVLTDLQEYIC